METNEDNQNEDRPSTSELLGTAPEQIDRQGREEEEFVYTSEPKQGNFFQMYIGTASIILVLLGITSLGIWFFTAGTEEPSEPVSITPVNFFSIEDRGEIELTGSTDITYEINQIVENNSINSGFLQIYFTETTDTGKRLIGGEGLLNRLAEEGDTVGIYLENDFMYGFHASTDDEMYPYLVFNVRDYDRAYGKMLQTENAFVEALQALSFPPAGEFSDDIIQNQDVRAATGGAGRRFYYSFPRQNILVVTTNESTLRAIFDRL